MKKYFTSLNLIFSIEVIVVILTSLGLISREAVLFLTGLLIFYMIFSPVEDSLWLTIASIPLFVAMPLSEGSNSIANWRVIIAVLFLCLFFKKGVSLNLIKEKGKIKIKENLKHYGIEYLMLIFLFVAAMSIIVAGNKIFAVKKLLFLINIFLLFLITRNLTCAKEAVLRVWRAAATGAIVVLAVAAIQFIAVLFYPLFSFWQFWAQKVILVFYGQNLAGLLSISNTWFAYYSSNPPTLRLFSIFPDSHSLAMFCILAVPIFLGLSFFYTKAKSRLFWMFTGLALFSIIMTGSRGAWLSAIPIMFLVILLRFKKIELALVKKILLSLAIFAAIFFASTAYPPLLYKFESWQMGANASSTFSFFERARSISDLEEISNKSRLEIWGVTLHSIANKPILGVGLGNYAQVLGQDVSASKKGASAHNLYLDFAAEIGVFGVLALLAIFADIIYTSWLVWRGSKESYFRLFGLAFGLYFLWVMAYSLFDVVLLNDKVLMFLMVGAATLYSLRNIRYNPEKL